MTAPQPWPTTLLCPATSNLPTRMLASTWQDLCAAMQRREAVGANRQNGMTPEDFAAISAARFPCATCGGRTLPPGLELITKKEASEMARQTKRGICELCGAHTNVGMNHGSAACPACTHVQTALNKRPESVAKAIRAMHKTEEMLGHLIPAGGGIAVKVTADLLQEISGIVGYDGEDPAELVEAVRKRALTCASCEAEDVLHEIREIVGYVPDQGDKGLADAVRAFEDRRPAGVPDCAECDAAKALLEIAELVGKRGASIGLVVEAVRQITTVQEDILRACGVALEDDQWTGWGTAVAAAIQTIAELLNTQYELSATILRDHEAISNLSNEITRLKGQTHSEREQVTALRTDLSRSSEVIEQLRAEITLLEQAHDEWEQRAVQAEQNVETLEAELQGRDRDEDRSFNRLGLLDIAIAALRGDAVPADQIAGLLAIARKVAA